MRRKRLPVSSSCKRRKKSENLEKEQEQILENREKARRWTDIAYIACLAVYLAYRTFFNTMIRLDFRIKRCKPAELCWLVFMALLIMFRALYLRCYSKVEFLIAVSFCVCILLSWRHARVFWLLMVPLAIVGAKGIPFDRIVKTFFITVGAVIGIALILSLVGVISNLKYTLYVDSSDPSKGIVAERYAFGTTYPTTFSEFVFFLSTAWLFLRRKVLKVFDVVLFAAVAAFLYFGSHAVTDTVCVAALSLVALLVIVLRQRTSRTSEIVHKLCAPLVGVTGLCAAVMTALLIGFDKTNNTWRALDRALHHRLFMGYVGKKYAGIYLFGTKVGYHTTGGNPELMSRPDYFNLDCSYHLILINFGIIIFLFIIGFFTISALRAWQKYDIALLLIIVVISLECVMENRLIQPQYDIFLLMVFADMESARGEKYLILSRNKDGGGTEEERLKAREKSALTGE